MNENLKKKILINDIKVISTSLVCFTSPGNGLTLLKVYQQYHTPRWASVKTTMNFPKPPEPLSFLNLHQVFSNGGVHFLFVGVGASQCLRNNHS